MLSSGLSVVGRSPRPSLSVRQKLICGNVGIVLGLRVFPGPKELHSFIYSLDQ